MTIQLGDVFLLQCTLCNPPKPKFFVVANSDPLWMFLINSTPAPFVRARPRLLNLQVKLAVAEHDFLRHDSYLDCHVLSFEYRRDKLMSRISLEPGIRKGQLSPDAMEAVGTKLHEARTLKRVHRDQLIELWPQAK